MPDLKLLRIESGDDQKSLIDKSNSNFSNVIAFGGGPYGKIGQEGSQGNPGLTGPRGSYGDLGIRGTIWEVTDTYPGTTGYLNGDFWLNTRIDSGLPIYQFNSNTWSSYGFNLISQDLFRLYSPVPTSTGDSGYSGYYISSTNPDKYTLVISDNSLAGATASANPQYSKFVISSDGSISGRPILEFAKADNLSNGTLYAKNPRFIWESLTASDNYSLRLLVSDSFFVDVPNSELSLKVTGNSGTGLTSKSSGLRVNLSGSQGLFMKSTFGRIIFDLTINGYVLFSNRNLTYLTDNFTLPVRFSFNSAPSDIIPPLYIISNKSYVGGLRHKTNVSPSRSSTLFRVYNSTDLLVNLFANGDLFYNKRITSVQAPQAPTTTSTGSAHSGSSGSGGGTGTPITVNWVSVVPTVVSPDATSTNRINASNGVDYLVSLASVSSPRGVCLWTPSEGGSALNDNGGWLQFLNPLESITIRVRASGTAYFRFIGLGSGVAYTTAPLDVSGSFQAIDLTNSNSLGVSDAEFTIVNLTNSTLSARNSYVKWFKVFYSAWGGTLNATRCGYMYAQIVQSSFTNLGSLTMVSFSLSQTLPFSTLLAAASFFTPTSVTYFNGYYNLGTSLSSSITFSGSPAIVTATLTLYPSATVISGTVSGSGTSRTITWTGVDLSTTTAYRVSIGGS